MRISCLQDKACNFWNSCGSRHREEIVSSVVCIFSCEVPFHLWSLKIEVTGLFFRLNQPQTAPRCWKRQENCDKKKTEKTNCKIRSRSREISCVRPASDNLSAECLLLRRDPGEITDDFGVKLQIVQSDQRIHRLENQLKDVRQASIGTTPEGQFCRRRTAVDFKFATRRVLERLLSVINPLQVAVLSCAYHCDSKKHGMCLVQSWNQQWHWSCCVVHRADSEIRRRK